MTTVVQAAHPVWSAVVCLAVLDTERQERRLGSWPGQLVWPTAFQVHIGWDPAWAKGGKLVLAEGEGLL